MAPVTSKVTDIPEQQERVTLLPPLVNSGTRCVSSSFLLVGAPRSGIGVFT